MRIFIEKEFDFLNKHPELPSFIINEMNREKGCSISVHNAHFEKIVETGIFQECMKAQNEGKMREISLLNITLLIMSNCQYPVMARNLMQSIHNISDEEYSKNLLKHKEYVMEMLVNYLFPKK
jgi:hypothetical protein